MHQTEIAVVDEGLLGLLPEERCEKLDGIDALMTNIAGWCIGVSTADSIPVLLYDPVHQAICAIHAGWRGTVQRIVEKAVKKMVAVYDTLPCDLIAQIGPGISLDSFEVGDEVYDAFAKEGFPMELISKKYPCNDGGSQFFTLHSSLFTSKWHIDLPECNRQQLLSMGIPSDHIAVSPVCTFLQLDTFFSARRLGINSGRIFSGIQLNPKCP